MKVIRKLIGIILIVLACYCLWNAFEISNEYDRGNEEYEKLVEENIDEEQSGDKDGFTIDWNSLYAQNADLVGWIKMDSGANYPIVKADTSTYYLHKGFNKKYNINGSIFMSSNNSSDFSDINTVIYGHNMNNGSMFGSNKKYRDKTYLQEHPYFYIYRPEGKYIYEIFNIMTTKDGSQTYQTAFPSQEAYQDYLNYTRGNASYETGVSVTSSNRIVTLSTCTGKGTNRFVIQGKLINIDEYAGQTVS